MIKVRKLSVMQLTPEQIEDVENYIQKLVTSIKEQFVEKNNDWLSYNYAFNLNESVIDELVKLFHKSKLFYKHSVDIAEQYDEISNALSLHNDPEIFRVVYPVLFFTLIMKNEINEQTIDSRIERGTKSWGKKQDVFDVPPWEKESIPEPISFINMQTNLAQQISRLKKIKHRSLSQQKILELAEQAEILLDYNEIMYTETSAKVGAFVGSILKYIYQVEKANKNNSTANIDTVLRFYLINDYNGIVSDSGILSNGMISPIPEKNILTEYCEEDGWMVFPTENESFQIGKVSRSNQCPLVLTESDSPKELYSCLSQLPFVTDDDIEGLFDYFFSEKSLQWYSEYYEHIKDHIFKIVHAKDDMGLVVDEYELEKLYAPFRAEYT